MGAPGLTLLAPLVALRRILGERLERLFRLLALAVAGQAQGVLVAHGGGLRPLPLGILPITVAADRRHDQNDDADDQRAVTLPDLHDPVAAVFLVDFADEIAHFVPVLAKGPVFTWAARLTQPFRDGEGGVRSRFCARRRCAPGRERSARAPPARSPRRPWRSTGRCRRS